MKKIRLSFDQTTNRWVIFWNVQSYVILLVSLVLAWFDKDLSWRTRWLCLALSALWGTWYWVFVVRYRYWYGRNFILAIAFVFGMCLASLLSWLHISFQLIVFAYYGLTFAILPARWAIGLIVLLSILLAARFIGLSGGLSEKSLPIILSFAAYAVFGGAFGLYFDKVIRTNIERKKMIEELEATRQELAAAERQAGILEERQRLAGEIHDTLAQGLTSIVMNLEAAEEMLKSNPDQAGEYILQARHTARESLTEARRFVWALKPELLERKPLGDALLEIAQGWEKETGIEALFQTTGNVLALSTAQEITLLRAAQEALTNIRKHAQAHRVTLTLSYMEDEVILDILDDGVGFDPGRQAAAEQDTGNRGFGLENMRKRVSQLGGELTIESAPGEGTAISVRLPGQGGMAAYPADKTTTTEAV